MKKMVFLPKVHPGH
jgi:cytochrome c1